MNILLTGSTGFIGNYFKHNYSHAYSIDTFSFLNDDLAGLDMRQFDTVVHLSALVHQMDGASEEEYRKANIIQTLALAKKAKESGVKHFIFISTVKVYGEETRGVYREDSPCHPQDAYGKSKLEAEKELQKLESNTFRVAIVRTPIVYGKGVKANIFNLIKLVKKIPVLPFAGIHNRRSMVYIGNLSAIIDRIIKTGKSGIFLASDDKALSTTEFVQLIASALDKKVFLVSVPFFPLLLKKIKPSMYKRLYQSLEVDNTVTKNELDFSNRYSVEEGVKLMIKEGMENAVK